MACWVTQMWWFKTNSIAFAVIPNGLVLLPTEKHTVNIKLLKYGSPFTMAQLHIQRFPVTACMAISALTVHYILDSTSTGTATESNAGDAYLCINAAPPPPKKKNFPLEVEPSDPEVRFTLFRERESTLRRVQGHHLSVRIKFATAAGKGLKLIPTGIQRPACEITAEIEILLQLETHNNFRS